MALRFREVQPVLAYAAAHLDEDISLAALAVKARLSRFQLHRLFTATVGETPKHLTLRLRLARAAALLLTTNHSVLDVALSCGFQSHEVFCRAFRRRFGMTPKAYRDRGFTNTPNREQANHHAALVKQVAPCIRLYRLSDEATSKTNNMTYIITKTELTPQRVLTVRRRVKRTDIAATISEVLPHIFVYAQQHGIALTGHPFTRYVESGLGLITMEPGMRVATSGQDATAIDPAWTRSAGEAEVVQDTLPGGPAAMTTHAGPYDTLTDAYAALEQWIEAQGLTVGGGPWESYVTDPAEHPDPQDWKTEIFWPLAR